MEFLTFAPLAWERFFPEEPSTSHWDLISREAGIVEGRKEWEERLTCWIAQEEQQQDEEGDQTLIQRGGIPGPSPPRSPISRPDQSFGVLPPASGRRPDGRQPPKGAGAGQSF